MLCWCCVSDGVCGVYVCVCVCDGVCVCIHDRGCVCMCVCDIYGEVPWLGLYLCKTVSGNENWRKQLNDSRKVTPGDWQETCVT
jgi:hypothetical protein